MPTMVCPQLDPIKGKYHGVANKNRFCSRVFASQLSIRMQVQSTATHGQSNNEPAWGQSRSWGSLHLRQIGYHSNTHALLLFTSTRLHHQLVAHLSSPRQHVIGKAFVKMILD